MPNRAASRGAKTGRATPRLAAPCQNLPREASPRPGKPCRDMPRPVWPRPAAPSLAWTGGAVPSHAISSQDLPRQRGAVP